MRCREQAAGRGIRPDLEYLAELGGMVFTVAADGSSRPEAARLSATGIDFYEQVVLKKDQFA